jgi:hypothetical protein
VASREKSGGLPRSAAHLRRVRGRGGARDDVDTLTPVRVALLHGRHEAIRAGLHRVALAAGAETALIAAVDESASFVEVAQAFRDVAPDAVLVSADAREVARAATLLEALRVACTSQNPPPRVFAIGDPRVTERLRAAAAPFVFEALADETAGVKELRALRREGADVPLRDELLEDAARALAASSRTNALVVDVSERSTSCVIAGPDGALDAVHLAPLGIGEGADRVIAAAGVDRVRRWLPWPIDAPALLERVYNRARWPSAVPASELALALEMALAREAIARMLDAAADAGLDTDAMRAAPNVLVTGRAASFPRQAQTLLVLVDGLEPTGLTTVWREPDDGHAERLGVAVTIRAGRRTTLRVTHAHGRDEHRIGRGSFELIPVEGDLDVAGAHVRATANAGALGLLIDARGRPLALPHRDADRLPAIARWYATVGALPGAAA